MYEDLETLLIECNIVLVVMVSGSGNTFLETAARFHAHVGICSLTTMYFCNSLLFAKYDGILDCRLYAEYDGILNFLLFAEYD